LLGADHEHDARASRGDRLQAVVHGGGTGGAGVLDPARALEAQVGRGLQHQRGGEILGREARVEMTEHDFVHVGGRNPRVGQRFARDAHNQALDRFSLEAAERRVRPADDASSHGNLLWFESGTRFRAIVLQAQQTVRLPVTAEFWTLSSNINSTLAVTACTRGRRAFAFRLPSA